MKNRNQQHGFTLIETMVVVSILAILATLAAPSFRELLAAQRVKNAASDLLADMMLARSEAIRRNRPVTISAINSSWDNGWSVVEGTETIKQRNLASSLVTVSKKSGTDDQVIFGVAGRSTGSFQMNFTASNIATDDQKRCVTSNSAGGQKILRGPC
jgi:type IV fimbrial biogenesis protein FimT